VKCTLAHRPKLLFQKLIEASFRGSLFEEHFVLVLVVEAFSPHGVKNYSPKSSLLQAAQDRFWESIFSLC